MFYHMNALSSNHQKKNNSYHLLNDDYFGIPTLISGRTFFHNRTYNIQRALNTFLIQVIHLNLQIMNFMIHGFLFILMMKISKKIKRQY